MRNPLAAYQQSRLHGIEDASPIKLVAMMLDEAVACVGIAIVACGNGDFARKGSSLGKAMSIIDTGLLSALDYEKGGDIALQLGDLYQYCLRALFEANAENDIAKMTSCKDVLATIRDGWTAAEATERH